MPVELIIQLLSGALGGNVFGALLKRYSLGLVGNSLAGIVGGGAAGQLLGPQLAAVLGPLVGSATQIGGLGLGQILADLVSGTVGGGIVMTLLGLVRSLLVKKPA